MYDSAEKSKHQHRHRGSEKRTTGTDRKHWERLSVWETVSEGHKEESEAQQLQPVSPFCKIEHTHTERLSKVDVVSWARWSDNNIFIWPPHCNRQLTVVNGKTDRGGEGIHVVYQCKSHTTKIVHQNICFWYILYMCTLFQLKKKKKYFSSCLKILSSLHLRRQVDILTKLTFKLNEPQKFTAAWKQNTAGVFCSVSVRGYNIQEPALYNKNKKMPLTDYLTATLATKITIKVNMMNSPHELHSTVIADWRRAHWK